MKPSTRITVGITGLFAVLFLFAWALFFWPLLNQKLHLLSPRMVEVGQEYEFKLLGFFLLVTVPFCAFLCGTWWLGRKMKVPYIVLLLLCLVLIAVGYWLVAGQLKGVIRG